MVIFFLSLCAVSFFFTVLVRRIAMRTGAVDQPTGGRKIHAAPVPLFGGIAVGMAIIVFLFLAQALGWFSSRHITDLQVAGFAVAIFILMVGGALDDRYNLPPAVQIFFPILAAILVMATGTVITQVTGWRVGHPFVLPLWLGSIVTFGWFLAVTFSMKLLDGLDGLVAGQTVIGCVLVGALALSAAYFQPSVAVLAGIVGCAFLGFLPMNVHPARQFLGEAGATIAGFSLAFIAIIAGAKVATSLMVVGLPLSDAALVVIGRISRGASPFRGDDTHLHFKLLKAGLSQRFVVAMYWSVALLFGLAALGVQTRGKILLLCALIGLTLVLSWLAHAWRRFRVARQK